MTQAQKNLEKKWNEIIVSNGWHKQGRKGAEEAIKTYGNYINVQRASALAEYARERGSSEFAIEVEAIIDSWAF